MFLTTNNVLTPSKNAKSYSRTQIKLLEEVVGAQQIIRRLGSTVSCSKYRSKVRNLNRTIKTVSKIFVIKNIEKYDCYI